MNEKCNCQYEEGHSFVCPLYVEKKFMTTKEQLIEVKLDDGFEFFNTNPTPTGIRTWLRYVVSSTYEAGVLSEHSRMSIAKTVECSEHYERGKKEERERIFKNVGFLRQWCNEKPMTRLVDDADIISWLEREV